METSLVKQAENRISRARSRLSADQIAFAEWLALPFMERQPKHQKDLAAQLGISEKTLTEWKKIPEIWEVRDSVISTKGKELVSEAMAVMEKVLKSPNLKLASEAARDILDRWAEPTKHAHIVATIKDMYDRYHGAE